LFLSLSRLSKGFIIFYLFIRKIFSSVKLSKCSNKIWRSSYFYSSEF